MGNEFERIMVQVPEWAIPHWWVVAYKILPKLSKEFGDLVQIRPDERFNTVVGRYIQQVMTTGKMPPADIAPTILNLVNDLVNGNEMIIRTGDYIAIQKHLRGLR